MCDGKRILPLASSKDYKRIGENDEGPNTGGMGAHSPAGVASFRGGEDIVRMSALVLEEIMHPVIAELAEMNRPFRGFLYAGLVLTPGGIRVLEFNVRMGDPETQPLMMRMEDDLLPVLAAGADGDFGVDRFHFAKAAAACVVLAAEGYPGKAVTGEVIEGLEAFDELDGVEVFHAGTSTDAEGRVISAGGRVLSVCSTGPDLTQALRRTYDAAALVRWPHKYMRRDIGRRIVEGGDAG
jgi:phosphoribosylamine--glycine ligase